MEVIRQAADEVAYDRGREALKNVQIAARALDIAYERGLRVPTLKPS